MWSIVKKYIPLSVKQSIRARAAPIEVKLPDHPRAFVFLAADYGNRGDLAIAQAQQKFLSSILHSYHVVGVPSSKTFGSMRSIGKQIGPDDLVTLIGGGNMGSRYSDIELLRQRVIRRFPRNRVVCFPQTLDWDDSEASQKALEKIVKCYSRHPRLDLFARETVTFDKLGELFHGTSVRVGLAPDIVLSATGQSLGLPRESDVSLDVVLLCLRNDGERKLKPDDVAAVRHAIASADLKVRDTDTHVGGVGLEPDYREELVAAKLAEFRAARLVVTDRLHGMILSLLAGTPCVVLPNVNHKIHQTWVDWLTHVSQVRFLEVTELEGAERTVNQLLAVPHGDPGSPVVDPKHFAGLRRVLEGQ